MTKEKEQKGLIYRCPECKFETLWTLEDFADRGEPVCPDDDSDMKRA